MPIHNINVNPVCCITDSRNFCTQCSEISVENAGRDLDAHAKKAIGSAYELMRGTWHRSRVDAATVGRRNQMLPLTIQEGTQVH